MTTVNWLYTVALSNPKACIFLTIKKEVKIAISLLVNWTCFCLENISTLTLVALSALKNGG